MLFKQVVDGIVAEGSTGGAERSAISRCPTSTPAG
jgi:hypothetical protein